MEKKEHKTTPMMEQWHACKSQAKEALLLFRMGDFYEAFYEDAEILAKELELTLTKRQQVPMSGIPWHSADNYIDRLISKGYVVAIAEQLEDPKVTKGLVKRGIVRVLTPGTHITSDEPEKKHHYIASLAQVGSLFGLAVCDLSTGSFFASEFEGEKELFNEVMKLAPKELVSTKKFKDKHLKALSSFYVTELDEWSFDHKMAYAFLVSHFKVQHLDGFGLKGKVAPINAAGALLSYIQEGLSTSIAHIHTLKLEQPQDFLTIDSNAMSHLEIDALYKVIDHTQTPMGGRLLGNWLKKPLLHVGEIVKRQEACEELKIHMLQALKIPLKRIRDLERLMMKVVTGLAGPRDYVSLGASLEMIEPLKECLQALEGALFTSIDASLIALPELIDLLKKALVEEPAARLGEGEIFRTGYNAALDELTELSTHGKEWLARYQNQIREETGVKNLKIVYNKIFGYTIEVSRGQAKLLEGTFEKRQTLANCERFTSTALKEYENKIFSAEERKSALEKELFEQLNQKVSSFFEQVLRTAYGVAQLDALCSLATVAHLHQLVRPKIDTSSKLEIIEGRHPILEAAFSKECFIPNDTLLDGVSSHLMLITGPNMAGKSTYIRQVALIVILAQMGSFVPAKSAHIGLIDKIFTRIGAGDDLTRGQSTFMVEMSETANILNHVTPRSLVILDEIGRGTSTYDGLAIAWSVAEFLLVKRAKTLFATHYFELTALEETSPGACNYHAAVKELHEEIVFLHKIVKGSADRSYGIHVARLAGLPTPLITRAQELLNHLEQKGNKREHIQRLIEKKKTKEEQLLLF